MARAAKPKKLSSEALWDYALKALSARAHAAAEIRRKLHRKAISSSDVNAVMTKLREYGLADDAKFSEAFASAKLANSGVGRQRVLRELRARQVAPRTAEQAVETAFAGSDEDALAEKFLLKKYRGKDLPVLLAEEKNLAAAFRKLRMGGFSAATSLAVLRRHSRKAAAMADDLESDEMEQAP